MKKSKMIKYKITKTIHIGCTEPFYNEISYWAKFYHVSKEHLLRLAFTYADYCCLVREPVTFKEWIDAYRRMF